MITRIRSLFQRNLVAKIIALIAAVVLWSYVMNDQNPSTDGTFTVQLSTVNAPEGYKITYDAEKVKLKVRGPRSLFVNISDGDFKAYIDLKDLESGTHERKVKATLPQGMELVAVDPENVNVTLDPIVQKRIRSEFIVTGAPGPDTAVAHVTQDVRTVTIEGPKSAVDTVTRVIGYVGLSGNTEDFQLQVPLTAINSDGREVSEVRVVPSSTNVSVQMARGLTKKVVTVEPQYKEDLGAAYQLVSLKPDPAKVEIAGSGKVLAGINSIRTEAFSLADITKNGDKVVKLELPDGIIVTNQSITVHIVVKEKPKKQ